MKIKKTLISMVMAFATMATCLSTSAFAENMTEIDDYISENNYVATMEEYDKYHVGDVVTFEDGMQFVVWSREILPDEDVPDSYSILTKYIEYIPNQEIDFNCDDILDAVPLSNSGITPYFSASREHFYQDVNYEDNLTKIVATILTRFMYDGTNYPSVYAAEYRFSSSKLAFVDWDTTIGYHWFSKACTHELIYTKTFGSQAGDKFTVSVTCKADGTQA